MKKIMIFALSVVALLFTEDPAQASKKTNIQTEEFKKLLKKEEHISNELLLTFKEVPSHDELAKLKKEFQITKVENLGLPKLYNVTFETGTSLVTKAGELLQRTNIVKAEPNFEFKTTYTSSEPFFQNQWYLTVLNAEQAWDQTRGENHVVVAVLDGGVQVSHPDLKGKMVKPYDAVTKKTTFPADNHATHVAGVIAASFNKIGIAGIAPSVKIMPVNVFTGDTANTADVIRGIVYAADSGADVINFSMGGYGDNYPLKSAVNYARSKGVIIIAASGNDDTDERSFPASYPGVLSISATDKEDEVTWFTNFGEYIDFAAPGEDIFSTAANSGYMYMDGTSMATPVVSGTAALMLSKNPLLTENELRDLLIKSSVDLGDPGWDIYYGYGRIDMNKAVSLTPRAIDKLSVPANFYMKGNNTLPISFVPYSKALVSAYIVDAKGNMVKSFVSNKQGTGTAMSFNWNGMDSKGHYVSSGDYRLVVKTAAGIKSFAKVSSIKVADQIPFTLTPASTSVAFSPKLKALPVKFQLSKQAKITAGVYNSKGQLLHTFFTNRVWAPGDNYFYWSGKKADNTPFGDGTYVIRFKAIDFYNNVLQKNVNVKIDTKAPVVSVQAPAVYNGTGFATSTFSNNEYGTVTAKVVDTTGQTVKQLTHNKPYNAGPHAINWDGTNQQNTPAGTGQYQVVLDFSDLAGNRVTAKSNTIQLERTE
ncbi:S8 family serine peptidase [Fictibacillus barbaricus]|uniref:S8 family serine peptidase n=1 Tax=Fictibacillus barbaricus TaxID=182136 RepID=A0ABS2ZGW7_9BACL|nr:S8 family serine peptidase [Fictibacillus barbaricus]MBN3546666.1 S8 family serine peptidase [Fictibacillus barbaricus]GGB42817.1 hypothetical protein GCM10007199_05170 [Fictibacillus barbaricus]